MMLGTDINHESVKNGCSSDHWRGNSFGLTEQVIENQPSRLIMCGKCFINAVCNVLSNLYFHGTCITDLSGWSNPKGALHV